MAELNNTSPRKDSSGRDLFRVVMTDGLKVKTMFIYAFNVPFAIEKAKNNHPCLTFSRARKETEDTEVKQRNIATNANPSSGLLRIYF